MTKPTKYRHPQVGPSTRKAGGIGSSTAFLAASLMVSACGGGGGGTPPTPAPTPVAVETFTSWSDVQAGSTVEAQGLGKQVSYDYQKKTISPPQDAPPATVLFTFDSSGKLTRLHFTEAVSFSGADIGVLTDFVTAANDPSNIAAVSHPEILNTARAWNYQSFGFWEADLDPNYRTFSVFSVGAPTGGAAIPGVGDATFEGKVIGSYVNADGLGHTVLADLHVDVNWVDRSLGFWTTGTRISADGGNFGDEITSLNLPKADITNPTLNTLSYSEGANGFTGNLTTNGGLEGNSNGQFYGPTAEELGGVFVLQDPVDSTSLETYSGAYGASRLP